MSRRTYAATPSSNAYENLQTQFKQVISSLKSDGVIPDVIPASPPFTPSVLLSITWPTVNKEINMGEQIPPHWTIDEPEFRTFHEATEEEGLYTMIMTDPDAPSRKNPKNAQFRHWIQTGIKLPGNGQSQGNYAIKSEKGAVSAYYAPAPPPGTGAHRYVFLLFKEPSTGVNIPSDVPEASNEDKSRSKWNAMDFALRYNLKLAGATYFMTEAVA